LGGGRQIRGVGMQFHVISRLMVQDIHRRFLPLEPHVIVSISTPGDPKPNILPDSNLKDVLYLWFADVNRPIKGAGRVISQDDAKQIVDFYLKAKADNIPHLVAHCDAGVCRSGGVAAALCKIDTGDDEKIFKKSIPNMLVYNTILKEYYSRAT
jgi:predicted protein tyrosine phosphatase